VSGFACSCAVIDVQCSLEAQPETEGTKEREKRKRE
jgi:hypothetical protein